MINKLIILFFLALFWFAFSGEQEIYFLVAGAAACLFAWAVAIRLKLHKKMRLNWRVVPYVAWLFGQIALSSFKVLKLIWGRRPKLSPAFITLGSLPGNEVFYAMYANSITMTPGTVTLLIDEKAQKIVVHALTQEFAADIQSGNMAAKVGRVVK